MENGEKIIVGVNEFAGEEETPVDTLVIDDEVLREQCARLQKVRAGRDGSLVARGLARLRQAAAGTDNLLPPILDCVRSYATLGEMCDTLRTVYGEYREPSLD